MRRKSSFIICTALIIIANGLMISVINNGEEKLSNLLVIALALLCFPGFLWAINNEMTSLIRLESSLLLLLAVLSIMRLINRIDPFPDMVNTPVALVAFGLTTLLLVAGIARWISKNKRNWFTNTQWKSKLAEATNWRQYWGTARWVNDGKFWFSKSIKT